MITELEKAEVAHRKARLEFDGLKIEIQAENRRARAAAEALVAERYAAEREVLSDAYYKTKQALIEVKDATAFHPWDGKRVVGEVSAGKWSGLRKQVVGTVEVVRSNSIFPENINEWRNPKVGSVIIRKIKKDGTLSKQYHEKFQAGVEMLGGWTLEVDS